MGGRGEYSISRNGRPGVAPVTERKVFIRGCIYSFMTFERKKEKRIMKKKEKKMQKKKETKEERKEEMKGGRKGRMK